MSVYLSNISKNLTRNSSVLNVTVRFYARWSHRQPLRVLRGDRDKLVQKTVQSNQFPKQSNQNQQFIADLNKKFRNKKELSSQTNEASEIVNNIESEVEYNENVACSVKQKNGKFSFDKMKRNDPKLSTLMLTVKSRKRREQSNVVLLEGKRLIQDALLGKCIPETILFSRMSELESIKEYLPKDGFELYQVPYKDLQIWSSLTTCPGIMGIFKTPDISDSVLSASSLPVTVVCDNVREPGNLGAIIRCAAGAGCEKVLLTKGCVELWDTKVLRSAAGGHFHIKIKQKLTWHDIQSSLTSKSSIFIADNNNSINCQSSLSETPINTYDTVQYLNYPEIILIIGGETHGISDEAYQLTKQLSSCRLNIPLMNNVDSLNTGMAFAVIVFEMQRQLKSYIADSIERKGTEMSVLKN